MLRPRTYKSDKAKLDSLPELKAERQRLEAELDSLRDFYGHPLKGKEAEIKAYNEKAKEYNKKLADRGIGCGQIITLPVERVWKKFTLNIKTFAHQTEKAVKVKMPAESRWAGYEFWFPRKLLRIEESFSNLVASIPDDMEITLRKTHPRTFKVIDEKVVNADTIIEALDGYVPEETYEPEKVVTGYPEHLEPKKVEADASLIR